VPGDLGLNAENAVELDYNAAPAAWVGVTLDLRVVDSAWTRRGPSRQLSNLNARWLPDYLPSFVCSCSVSLAAAFSAWIKVY
jgi:hypothetical protein